MAFDQLLRRNFWSVNLVLVATAAYLSARGVSQLVGNSLAVGDDQLAAPPPVGNSPLSLSASLSTRATSAEPVLARNPFDHVTGPLNKVATVDETPTGPDLTQDPKAAPLCDGVKVLVIIGSPEPEWSFAALANSSDNKAQLRRRGSDFGSKKVFYVGWDRVWLSTDQKGGGLCQAELFKTPEGSRTAPSAPLPPSTPAPTSGGAPSVPEDIAKGIQRVSSTEFNVDRGVVDKILENQADLMKQARIVPEKENGKVVGIRMYGVRPETLLGTLGMENGDRLQTINGFDVSSPEKALEAYARLRAGASKLTVQVNRKGQTLNLDYNIK